MPEDRESVAACIWQRRNGNTFKRTPFHHPVSLRFSTELTEAERESLAEKIEKTGVRLQQSRELPYVYLAQNLENVSELPGFAEGKIYRAGCQLRTCSGSGRYMPR